MKVMFVTQIVPYPPHGGILQRGYNLLRELGKRHEVHLLAFHHPDELPPGEPVHESQRALGEFCRSVEYFSLWPKRSIVHKGIALASAWPSPRPFSVLAHNSSSLRARIGQACASSRPPDVLHLDTIALAPYRHVSGRVPCVLTHHNVESQLMRRRANVEPSVLARHYTGLQATRLERYEVKETPAFPLNIMVSDADAALLASMCPDVRTGIVPNGVDVEYFRPRPGSEELAVIYTGGMNMFANRDAVEWFLDGILPRIRERIPSVRFLAIGQRPSPRVQAASASEPGVEVPGFVPDIRPWVARASVYVIPLRVGGGTRLKVVDAMAQGKAIVSTRVGAEGIRGDDGTHFVLADDPAAFADAVVRLLQDPAERRRLGEAARRRAVEEYAWPILGDRLSSYYQQVVGEAKS